LTSAGSTERASATSPLTRAIDLRRHHTGAPRQSNPSPHQPQLMPWPRTIGSLAERLGVSQQAASKAVADLERRGCVRREADPADGRARRVALTARGDAVRRRRVRPPA
jgi:hypothetical protein